MHPQNINQSSKSGTGNPIFHCTVPGCISSDGTERFFTSKKLLKQHYTKVHAEKKYHCSKCQKGFGADWMRKSHETVCGKHWNCSCGNQYASRESLITHTRRTQHVLPPQFRHKQKRCNNSSSQPVSAPVIIIIQQQPIVKQLPVVIQIIPPLKWTSPSTLSPSKNSIKHRKILPKFIIAPKQQKSAHLSASHISKRKHISNVSTVGTQTDPLVFNINTWPPICDKVFSKKLSLPGTFLNSDTNNEVQIQASIYAAASTIPKSTNDSECQMFAKTAVETQTSENYTSKETRDQAVERQSRGSQCCARIFFSRPDVSIESTHTQTTESTVIKMKKASFRKMHYRKKKCENRNFELNNASSGFWKSLESSAINTLDWQKYISRCSSSTQTSPRSIGKTVCDSETLTDTKLFSSLWPEPENAYSLSQNQEMFGYIPETSTSDVRKGDQRDTEVPVNILSTSVPSFDQSISFPLEEISNAAQHINNNSTQQLFNTETQTEVSNILLNGAFVQQSVQTDIYPLLSHMQTQTIEDEEYYSNVLANMETQTTDEFLFPDLEFSDIETQTPWKDFPALDDESDPLGANFDFLCDDPFKLPSTSTILTDMETQTCYQFPDTELTSSYAQTLDLNFSDEIFNS